MKILFFVGLFFIFYLITTICDKVYKKVNNWFFNKLIQKNEKHYLDLIECEKSINAYFKFSYNKPEQIKECEQMMENLNEAIKQNAMRKIFYKSMLIK